MVKGTLLVGCLSFQFYIISPQRININIRICHILTSSKIPSKALINLANQFVCYQFNTILQILHIHSLSYVNFLFGGPNYTVKLYVISAYLLLFSLLRCCYYSELLITNVKKKTDLKRQCINSLNKMSRVEVRERGVPGFYTAVFQSMTSLVSCVRYLLAIILHTLLTVFQPQFPWLCNVYNNIFFELY